MRAAVVEELGRAPRYSVFADPTPEKGEVRITVTAAAISQLARGRVTGRHYSSTGEVPFVAGIDGVGRLDDGRRVYFVLPRPPHGSMAAKVVVPIGQCLPLPDGLGDLTAAAIANPGMSSWVALTERAQLKAGETVLINGATGTSGRLAVQIAKHLGAKKVIATGRNADALLAVKALGADETISLLETEASLGDRFAQAFDAGVDVVVDYLWGKSAEQLLVAAAKHGRDAVPIRYVEVGAVSGGDISLPAAVLRSSAVTLMGSGIGSVPFERLIDSIGELFRATMTSGFQIAIAPMPLSSVEKAWAINDSAARTVLTIAG